MLQMLNQTILVVLADLHFVYTVHALAIFDLEFLDLGLQDLNVLILWRQFSWHLKVLLLLDHTHSLILCLGFHH